MQGRCGCKKLKQKYSTAAAKDLRILGKKEETKMIYKKKQR